MIVSIHRRIAGVVLTVGLSIAIATLLSAQIPNAAGHDSAKVKVIGAGAEIGI